MSGAQVYNYAGIQVVPHSDVPLAPGGILLDSMRLQNQQPH